MKQILIAVDNDLLAERVVRQGSELARAIGASVTVCHVMPEEHYRRVEEQQVREEQSYPISQAEAEAREVVEAAIEHVPASELNVDVLGAVGDPPDTIVKLGQQLDADYIVMGFEGLRGLGRLRALGSVSRAVMEKTKRPVLIVPAIQVQDEEATA